MHLRAAILATLALANGAHADTVTLAPSRDTTIYENDGSLSNGAGSYIFAGRTNDGPIRRALIAFDIAGAVPPGSTVMSVTLTMSISRTRDSDETVALHRVTAAWGEGTSDALDNEGMGAPATPGDATWTHRMYPSTPWAAPGGDFAATPSVMAIVGRMNTTATWTSTQMRDDVQAWLDTPATNQGWMVIGAEMPTRSVKRFDSGENVDPSVRPALEIVFMASGATGACCAADGACTIALDPGAACTGMYRGAGTMCAPNPCPQPMGACCLADASGTCNTVTATMCTTSGGSFRGIASACDPNPCPFTLAPFVDALPIPSVAVPTRGTPSDEADYRIAIRQITQRLHRDLPPTTVWVYDDGTGGSYPGPTIEARRDRLVSVEWANDLREGGALRTQHLLPVDSCPHGAETPNARTVIHLHGGHVPAIFDGYPEATQLPGQSVTFLYPNWQEAATLWYHDHALGITRLNVYLGLAGMYLVRDDVEDALELPRGEYEIPLVMQDRTFARDGSLVYPEMWEEHFFGDTMLVNGAVWPYLDVAQGKYRFRLLNGSNSRTLTLALSNGASFTIIGTDTGLLEAPIAVPSITLGPAERADVIVDFETVASGTTVTLTNSAPAPYPGAPGEGVIPNVMQFRVMARAGHTAPIPTSLRARTPIDPSEAVMTRDFRLSKGPDDGCGHQPWMINGRMWHDIDERPALGTTEIWRFINPSGVAHPMHVHLVSFEVLDRQLFTEVGGVINPIGSATPPEAWESGPKDTVLVGAGEIVRVIARFEDFTGRFAYHCHVLEHEDHEMMRQMEVVTTCGDGARGVPEEECDDGNTTDGDGCSATCTFEGEVDAGPLFRDAGIGDAGTVVEEGGCGCRAGGGAIPLRGIPLLLLALLFSRRRQRR